MRKTYMFVISSALLLGATNVSAAFITSSGDAALSGGSVIDFEDQTLGTYTSLTIGDVTFTASDNHLRIDNTYQGYNQSGIYLDNGTYGNNGFGTLNIDFSGSTSAFGFTWGMAESFASWNLSAYDSSSSLIESYILPSTGSSSAGEFFGISAAGIASASLSWQGSYDWIAVDDFTWASASVPEPSTLLLLGAGLAGLFAARRRQPA
ncbi:PEP-CTERM sorting domain-containing protein [Reinekea marinisedimentorum]|uniref:Putative secreted protein with PEP-CTERM sorting signal n=1 Tax=Reinekea marinisedimentorum TaxID=230495 RepID=A0A4R3IDS4_9GAMM|nr:PEP-CTERM sorting domain-containing protein [Reinekea marinisedimentorum]TCS43926.1 putative secreted protein with PEP-CTERM sorting signal [Reinekea marinisedimentorum]